MRCCSFPVRNRHLSDRHLVAANVRPDSGGEIGHCPCGCLGGCGDARIRASRELTDRLRDDLADARFLLGGEHGRCASKGCVADITAASNQSVENFITARRFGHPLEKGLDLGFLLGREGAHAASFRDMLCGHVGISPMPMRKPSERSASEMRIFQTGGMPRWRHFARAVVEAPKAAALEITMSHESFGWVIAP